MPRLEGSLHGLKADPSTRADDQDCRHGVILADLPGSPVMCDAGSHIARLQMLSYEIWNAQMRNIVSRSRKDSGISSL